MSTAMQIIDHGTGSLQQDCVLLLGYFDGVHIGHRKLIAKAKAIAAERGCLVGITTFYDSKNGRQIYTFAERVRLFEQLGIDFVYAAAFDERFRATEGDEFLRHVCARLSVCAFVCGIDYTYGKDAAGNTGTLRAFCKDRGIPLYVEELVNFSGEKAASAQAKRYLDAGDVQGLARLLGAPYFICGTVSTEGRQVGRKLGFPTALQWTIASISWLVVLALINQYGVTIAAANGVSNKIRDFCQLFISALTTGGGTMCAQCLGARLFDRAEQVMKTCLKLSLALAAVIIVVAEVFAPQFAMIFTPDPEVQRWAVINLRIEIICQLFYAAMFAYNTLATGSGHTVFVMWNSFLNCIVVRLILAVILDHFFGIYGVYVACGVAVSSSVPVCVWFYRSKRWMTMKNIR